MIRRQIAEVKKVNFMFHLLIEVNRMKQNRGGQDYNLKKMLYNPIIQIIAALLTLQSKLLKLNNSNSNSLSRFEERPCMWARWRGHLKKRLNSNRIPTNSQSLSLKMKWMIERALSKRTMKATNQHHSCSRMWWKSRSQKNLNPLINSNRKVKQLLIQTPIHTVSLF